MIPSRFSSLSDRTALPELVGPRVSLRVAHPADECVDPLNADRDLRIMIANAVALAGVDAPCRRSGLDLLHELGEHSLLGGGECLSCHVQTQSPFSSVQSMYRRIVGFCLYKTLTHSDRTAPASCSLGHREVTPVGGA